MVYKALLLNRIQPEVGEIDQQLLRFRPSVKSSKKYKQKNEATLLFVDFSKVFDSIHRGKMNQILLAYSLPKETVTAIMMFYKNTNAKVYSLDCDTDFFEIVLQGDTLAPHLFIIYLITYYERQNI